VSDQAADPYKETGKIIVLYILLFWIVNWKIKDCASNESNLQSPLDFVMNGILIR
jgi:hypothetical protein